jgi:hypothetical protein
MLSVSKSVRLGLRCSKLVVRNKTQPDTRQNPDEDEVSDIRTGRNDHVDRRELEAQTIIDNAENDGATSYPPMNVGEDALATGSLEIPMLEDTQDGLKDEDCADDEQTDDDVRRYWVLEVVQNVRESDPQAHGSEHHDGTEDLDWGVDCWNFVSQIGIFQVRDAVDGQVDGYGAKRVKDDKNNRHHAGMTISHPVEF